MRTDDDSWDITTSVGATALFVAAARALEARKPDPLAVDPYAEVFCRAVGGDWAALVDGTLSEHKLISEFGDFFVSYQGARTRYFDAYFAAAAAAGVRQIVVLAAGLDSRALRLDWAPETDIYEVDQPQVLEFKRRVLADRGDEPRARRHEVAVDLRDDWQGALQRAGFSADEPSAWIAEGLLMYLPASAQEQLFSGIDALSAPGSRVAVEESQPMPAEALAAKRGDEASEGDDNVYFSLIYNEQFAPAADYFAGQGWEAEAVRVADHLAELGRPVPAEPADNRAMADTQRLVSARKK